MCPLWWPNLVSLRIRFLLAGSVKSLKWNHVRTYGQTFGSIQRSISVHSRGESSSQNKRPYTEAYRLTWNNSILDETSFSLSMILIEFFHKTFLWNDGEESEISERKLHLLRTTIDYSHDQTVSVNSILRTLQKSWIDLFFDLIQVLRFVIFDKNHRVFFLR